MKVQRYFVDGVLFAEELAQKHQECMRVVRTADYDALMRKVERLGKIKHKLSQRLCATREKLCKVAQERDGHRERADILRRALRFYAQNSPHSDTAKNDNGGLAQAALAATEVK